MSPSSNKQNQNTFSRRLPKHNFESSNHIKFDKVLRTIHNDGTRGDNVTMDKTRLSFETKQVDLTSNEIDKSLNMSNLVIKKSTKARNSIFKSEDEYMIEP